MFLLQKNLKHRTKYEEINAEIVEITNFRTNYIEKRYEYQIKYKNKLSLHWVPAPVIENDPKISRFINRIQ